MSIPSLPSSLTLPLPPQSHNLAALLTFYVTVLVPSSSRNDSTEQSHHRCRFIPDQAYSQGYYLPVRYHNRQVPIDHPRPPQDMEGGYCYARWCSQRRNVWTPLPPLLFPRLGYFFERMLNISRLGRGFKIRTRSPSWSFTR